MATRRRSSSVAQTIGGIMAGLDGQVFRSTPPPHELVRKGDRLPSSPAGDGGTLIVELPEDRSEPARQDLEPAD